jgi:hypothetical protein
MFTPMKTAIAVAWLISVLAVGITLPVTSTTGWITIVAFGALPFVFMRLAWREPVQTLSESISKETSRR